MQTWFSYVEHRKTQTMFTLCVQMPFQNSFCCGQASCPYCSDATHNINWSDSAPLKKVEQSDFEIHFAKCEQHEMVQGSMEIKFSSKSFKILFPELSNQNHFFSAILVILGIVYICFSLQLTPYYIFLGCLNCPVSTMQTLHSGTFHRLSGQVVAKHQYFGTNPIRKLFTQPQLCFVLQIKIGENQGDNKNEKTKQDHEGLL